MDITVIPLEPIGGRNKIITTDHYGPSNYKTGGETWPSVNPNQVTGGPNSLGMASVGNILSAGGVTQSGTYYIVPIFGGKGSNNSTVKIKWYVVATDAEVAAAVNLSAEVIRLSVLGG
jgi:hypothetical protein